MRILQIIQRPQLRGAEIFASQLSNQLMQLDHTTAVVCLFEGNGQLPYQGEIIEFNRPSAYRFFDFKGWKRLAQLINELKPDIIQANAGDTLKYAVFSKLFFRWKQPLVYRNANMMSDFIDSRVKLWLNAFLVRKIDQVVSVSENCRLDFIKTFNFPEDRIVTVPIGIDCRQIGMIPKDLNIIFKRGEVLTHVGSMVPEKNHQALFRIFKQLLNTIPNAQLILLGDGKLKAGLKEFCEQTGIGEQVHFLGNRTDVLEIVYASQVFVLPSLIEGLPAAILESFFCKTPVVAYDVGGISEVLKNNSTGWLVPMNDEKNFLNAVLEALQGEQTLAQTENAFHVIINHYDNRIIAKRFLTVYEAVNSKHSKKNYQSS